MVIDSAYVQSNRSYVQIKILMKPGDWCKTSGIAEDFIGPYFTLKREKHDNSEYLRAGHK